MIDIPWLLSSSESETEEKQLIDNRHAPSLNSKMNEVYERHIFPSSMSSPEYMIKGGRTRSSSSIDDNDAMNLQFAWGSRIRHHHRYSMALDDILYIQKGKVTSVAKFSRCPSSHILSIVSKQPSTSTKRFHFTPR